MFSDLEIGIQIQITEEKIHKLYTDITELIEIGDYEDLKSESNTERTILLNMTFLQGTTFRQAQRPVIHLYTQVFHLILHDSLEVS
jgi:hypothetical protein